MLSLTVTSSNFAPPDFREGVEKTEADVALRRIDKPHIDPALDEKEAIQPSLADHVNEAFSRSGSSDGFDPQALRAAHADDLLTFLQSWSEELDERASRLHADMASQERRERAFRLWMQNRRAELEAQIETYHQAQSQAETAARRLAITEP